MTLSAYLREEGLTNAEFARIMRVSQATVSLWCRGEMWLSREAALKIVKATKGKVTPNDFLRPAGR